MPNGKLLGQLLGDGGPAELDPAAGGRMLEADWYNSTDVAR